MEFYISPEGRIGLRRIPPILADLLREIPRGLGADEEAAEERLFPMPTGDPEENALREDWKAHVQPELHEWFRNARQVVEADLRGMQEEDGEEKIEFAARHADAWLNALNQARLALAARHGLGENELSRTGSMVIRDERDYALLQINFYAALQQWLVESLEGAE